MFQKCPLCNGTGIHTHILNTGNPTIKCDVCKGQKIISQLTGKPPVEEPYNIIRYKMSGNPFETMNYPGPGLSVLNFIKNHFPEDNKQEKEQ